MANDPVDGLGIFDNGTILNVVQSLKVMGIVFLIVLTIGTLVYVIGLLIGRGNSVSED